MHVGHCSVFWKTSMNIFAESAFARANKSIDEDCVHVGFMEPCYFTNKCCPAGYNQLNAKHGRSSSIVSDKQVSTLTYRLSAPSEASRCPYAAVCRSLKAALLSTEKWSVLRAYIGGTSFLCRNSCGGDDGSFFATG